MIALLASCLIFLSAILASSARVFACLTNSLLLSSVSSGIAINISSPVLLGVNPKSASNIAFSILARQDLSNGLIWSLLASGTDMVANWLTRVRVP